MRSPTRTRGWSFAIDCLWKSEKIKGREEESKYRPCAIVVAIGGSRALVCGITHSAPDSPDDGVEIPLRQRAALGLDDERQWVVTSEANIIDWDDLGIVPLGSGEWSYGELTREFAEEVRSSAITNLDQKRLTMIRRGLQES